MRAYPAAPMPRRICPSFCPCWSKASRGSGRCIFVEASAQLLCATPTAHWLEVLDAAGGLRCSPLVVRDGHLHPSEAPGIGLE